MNESERFYATRGIGRPPTDYRVDPDAITVVCPGTRGRSCGVRIPISKDRILCQYCTRTVELLLGITPAT